MIDSEPERPPKAAASTASTTTRPRKPGPKSRTYPNRDRAAPRSVRRSSPSKAVPPPLPSPRSDLAHDPFASPTSAEREPRGAFTLRSPSPQSYARRLEFRSRTNPKKPTSPRPLEDNVQTKGVAPAPDSTRLTKAARTSRSTHTNPDGTQARVVVKYGTQRRQAPVDLDAYDLSD